MPESPLTDMEVFLVSRRWGRPRQRPARRQVISETAFRLYVDNVRAASFCCLDEYLEELALGFLYTSGRIDSPRAVSVTSRREDELRLTLTSAPAAPPKAENLPALAPGPEFSMDRIWRLMRAFVRQSPLFASSGGVHSALLLHRDFQLFNEDIGRHNCIDKIAGRLLVSGATEKAGQALMLSSGRVTVEIVTKLLRLGVPVLVSRTTPTAQAVTLARKSNMTLAGYVRGSRGVIYSGRERIKS